MNRLFHFSLSAFALSSAAPVLAFPDGTPASFARVADCTSCHFGSAPVDPSESIALEGLHTPLKPGATYALAIEFAGADMKRAGFRLLATANGKPAGTFLPTAASVEVNENMARSLAAAMEPSIAGLALWALSWTAPDPLPEAIEFSVDANAANGDNSPLGDVIHRRKFEFDGARP